LLKKNKKKQNIMIALKILVFMNKTKFFLVFLLKIIFQKMEKAIKTSAKV